MNTKFLNFLGMIFLPLFCITLLMGCAKTEKPAEEPAVKEQGEEKTTETAEKTEENSVSKNPETDYRCRLEGTELKFL